MAEPTPITITVREADLVTLDALTESQRRDREQQAGWMLEQALQTHRAKAEQPTVPRRSRTARTIVGGAA